VLREADVIRLLIWQRERKHGPALLTIILKRDLAINPENPLLALSPYSIGLMAGLAMVELSAVQTKASVGIPFYFARRLPVTPIFLSGFAL
jgi:hypothetical protein